MRIFTKRNALLGWIVYLVARRRIEKRVESGHKVRNGILAGVGLAAGAAAVVAFWARRGQSQPAQARA
jgi:hypothetical protein